MERPDDLINGIPDGDYKEGERLKKYIEHLEARLEKAEAVCEELWSQPKEVIDRTTRELDDKVREWKALRGSYLTKEGE